MSRRKRSVYAFVGMGLALGAAAVLLWPQLQRVKLTSTLTVGRPTINPAAQQMQALLQGAC